jgi:hypothetical protein
MAKAKTKAKTKTKAKAKAKRTATGKKTAARKLPNPRDLAAFMGVRLETRRTTAQIQRLRKALPGYASLLDDVAELIEADAADLNLKDVRPADLLRVQAQQKDLSAREAVLEMVYRTVYEQRLQVDDEGIGMLQQIARRVQSRAEENPDLPLRYKTLLDFLGTFRGGGRPAKSKGSKEKTSPES